jgi:hypothetical protein
MEQNKLEKSFRQAVEEISLINGRLSLLNNVLVRGRADLEQNNPEDFGISTVLSFRDLTKRMEEGNLYLFNKIYYVRDHNMDEELDMVLSRELLLQVAQLYEIVETYLYNIVAEFVRLKSPFHIFPEREKNVNTHKSVRKALKGLSERTNNRHLFNILRANNKTYSWHEKNNAYNIDFEQWYEMFSEIRHCVTHQRMKPDQTFPQNKLENFNRYMTIRPVDGMSYLFVTYEGYFALSSKLMDFIAFIYKAVSQDCNDGTIEYANLDKVFVSVI